MPLRALQTLWINTGTLCNLTCVNRYIKSSPTNDRLAYITTAEVTAYLDEIAADGLGTEEIGFTGGEPFMNPEMIDILEARYRAASARWCRPTRCAPWPRCRTAAAARI